jgi:hypothetical protein
MLTSQNFDSIQSYTAGERDEISEWPAPGILMTLRGDFLEIRLVPILYCR